MTAHPLKQGTWIRSRIPVQDSGDYNEREAPAGAVGRIDTVDAGRSNGTEGWRYSVSFVPSGISNVWDDNEIESSAEVLPGGHPDIPNEGVIELADAVSEIYASGEHDFEAKTTTFPDELGLRISRCIGVLPNEAEHWVIAALAVSDQGNGKIVMAHEVLDTIADLAGVRDRLGDDLVAPDLAPRR